MERQSSRGITDAHALHTMIRTRPGVAVQRVCSRQLPRTWAERDVVFWDAHQQEEQSWDEHFYQQRAPSSNAKESLSAPGLKYKVFLQHGCKLCMSFGLLTTLSSVMRCGARLHVKSINGHAAARLGRLSTATCPSDTYVAGRRQLWVGSDLSCCRATVCKPVRLAQCAHNRSQHGVKSRCDGKLPAWKLALTPGAASSSPAA